MLIKALLVALWAGITGIDLFNGLTHIHRPVVTGVVVGIILGDMKTGLIAGGMLELVWMGMVPLAGAQPPNVVIGGIIGTSFAILSKQEPNVAVSIAVPFALAAQAGITLLFTAFSPVMHTADNYAKNANGKGIDRINYLGITILFISYFICAFLPVYFGAEKATDIVNLLPATFIEGLKVAGGMMPAIGFAILLKIMLKKEYVAFLIVGFILVTFLKLSILAVALLATAIALYDYYQNKPNGPKAGNKEVRTDGI
ncbi:PTS N-acetylgalactosamine transporter subunit IIC [Clostridiaceae bacterium M8S5]|nr:PTS N-acetylgalactosamine transporter subunit IIC [Clostridiaceae bacterium M8S5]